MGDFISDVRDSDRNYVSVADINPCTKTHKQVLNKKYMEVNLMDSSDGLGRSQYNSVLYSKKSAQLSD